ncbi:MAG: class I SAM-dependent methyltransferase [Blastomonas sp.]
MATQFDAGERAGGTGVADASSLSIAVREFLRSPQLVGSAFPASRYLVDKLLAPVDWSKVKVAVEYGPGSGPLTRAMLARMPLDSRLVAIDVSPHFTQHLRRTIDDPRLLAVTASASSVAEILASHGLRSADLIVTGIPFSTMSPQMGHQIVDASAKVLAPRGQLLAYQMRTAVAALLERRFGKVRKSFVWRNIPPCHLYWASQPQQPEQ